MGYLSKSWMAVAAGLVCGLGVTAHGATMSFTLVQADRTAVNGAMGTIDLTEGGKAADWIKPSGTSLYYAQKASTSALTLVTTTTATLAAYGNDGYLMTWSGGEASGGGVSGSSYAGARYTPASGHGYRMTFTVPKDGDYELTWYTAAVVPATANATTLSGNIAGTAATSVSTFANVGLTTGDGVVDELTWRVSIAGAKTGEVATLNLVNNVNGVILAVDGVSVTAVPEPTSAGVIGLGVGALGLARRRRA